MSSAWLELARERDSERLLVERRRWGMGGYECEVGGDETNQGCHADLASTSPCCYAFKARLLHGCILISKWITPVISSLDFEYYDPRGW